MTECWEDASSEVDPDYVPSDDEDDACSLVSLDYNCSTYDRCLYIRTYREELLEIYEHLLTHNRQHMGPAFLQLCSFHNFANFCYRHSQPTSD